MIKSRRMRWVGHVARIGKKRNAYRILVGTPEGKRPLGRPGRRWVDDIKMDVGEIGWYGMDWIGQWMILVHTVMNLLVPQNSVKFLSGCIIDSFSRRAQLRK
jgi:hypothetical protein